MKRPSRVPALFLLALGALVAVALVLAHGTAAAGCPIGWPACPPDYVTPATVWLPAVMG